MSGKNFVDNAVGRKVPLEIDGKNYHPYAGAFASPPQEDKRRVGPRPGTILHPGEKCLVPTIRDAIERIELKDGMTISFHHHFREGDKVLNLVMGEIAAMGIKDLTLAPSSLYSVHEPLIDHIKNGVVTCIEGGSARGKVGRALSRGLMDRPINIRSHGGRVRAIERGDLHIDAHHTVEDIGITLGQVFDRALGDRKGIRRYGHAYVPLDEALSRVVIDFSGRPGLEGEVEYPRARIGSFDVDLFHEFFQGFVNHAGVTLHLDNLRGRNAHHIAETLFKAFGRALRMALEPDPRMAGIMPSTKGSL